MAVSRDELFARRTSRIVLAITAAAGLCAAVAAAPSVSIGKESNDTTIAKIAAPMDGSGETAKGVWPLGRGPAIRVGRAFDAEDEDCTVVVTRVTDEGGHVRVKRGLSCAN